MQVVETKHPFPQVLEPHSGQQFVPITSIDDKLQALNVIISTFSPLSLGFIASRVTMGKKRRSTTPATPSESATKKLFVKSNGGQQGLENDIVASSEPEIVCSDDCSGKKREPTTDKDGLEYDEELGLIESTMIELLIRRGPEKTC